MTYIREMDGVLIPFGYLDFLKALVAIFFGSVLLEYAWIRNAFRLGFEDKPTERGLHSKTTPRGGGIVFVFLWIIAWVLLKPSLGELLPLRAIPSELKVSLWVFCAPVLVALIGLLDDRVGVAAWKRLVVQLLSAIFVLLLIPRPENGVLYQLGLSVFTVLFLVWFTNIYNFMDGSDGLAVTQGIQALLVYSYLFWVRGDFELSLLSQVGCASLFGFLVFNWSPARVFMGDVGSGFLGFSLGLIAWVGWLRGSFYIHEFMSLFAWFIWDTSTVLIKRALTGKNLFQAHREHQYQALILNGMSHRSVCFLVLLVNFVVFAAFKSW